MEFYEKGKVGFYSNIIVDCVVKVTVKAYCSCQRTKTISKMMITQLHYAMIYVSIKIIN